VEESPHYIEWVTNASLGLRLTQMYHKRFYMTFTATIPAPVNIGFGGDGRQSRIFHGESAKQIRAQPLRFRQE
jgi:hypothetical protein